MDSLIIPIAIYQEMLAEVSRRAPEEACGLLGGVVQGGQGLAARAWALTNRLHSPVRYQIDPLEQLAAFQAMDDAGLSLVAIYHSHPHGPPHPSPTDIAEAFYPESVYLIWAHDGERWSAQAFHIQNEQTHPVIIQTQ